MVGERCEAVGGGGRWWDASRRRVVVGCGWQVVEASVLREVVGAMSWRVWVVDKRECGGSPGG